MPRLVPRILAGLANAPENEVYIGPLVKQRKQKSPLNSSQYRTPSFHYSRGRKSSVLLDGDGPLTEPNLFCLNRHKDRPPAIRCRKNVGSDGLKEMTELEKQWHSNPYLRMLSSPLRTCFVTERVLPIDFAIRLSAQLLPNHSNKSAVIFLPDGLQHPQFAKQTYGIGNYIVCWKDIVSAMSERGSIGRQRSRAIMHSHMIEHIGHLLRLRIIQELEILSRNLIGIAANTPVIRRLTREEWSSIKQSGVVPWEDVVALLVIPPLRKDLKTQKRPVSDIKSTPPEELRNTRSTILPLPSLSISFKTTGCISVASTGDDLLPHLSVPLYNGLALFPWRGQRAAFYKKLSKILYFQHRIFRHAQTESSDGSFEEEGSKKSYTYAIFSNTKTVVTADTVPLAIALWRVRMWEGGGYSDLYGWQMRDLDYLQKSAT